MTDRLHAIRRTASAGRVDEALREAAALCAEQPDDAPAARLYAMLLSHAGKPGATSAWERLLALVPDDAEAHFQLGNAAGDRGDFATAVVHLEAARRTLPRHAVLLNNLALALESSGDLQGAIVRYREAMSSEPRAIASVRPSLARALFRARRYAEALDEIDSMATPARDATWLGARAACLGALGRDAQALDAYRAAVAAHPDSAVLWHDFVRWLLARGRHDEAHDVLVQAHAALPGDTLALCLLAASLQRRAEWAELPRLRALLVERVADPCWEGSASGYDFTALVDDPALQRRVAERYAAGEVSAAPASAPPRAAGADASARLHLGFVSSDYRDHPVGRLVLSLLERLDRTRFHVTAYTTGAADDVVGDRLAAAGAGPMPLPRRDPAAAAQRLRADAVDILFDLNGFSGGEALRIFAARPAPLQVNFLGYTGTLGSRAYDRIVTDRYCVPPQAASHYVERALYVEPCYLPSDDARQVGALPSRATYGLPHDAVVMYAGSALYKVAPEIFDTWLQVLRDAPASVLWLRDAPRAAADRLRAAAVAGGIDPARLVFAPAEPLPQYLARLALADLFLDTTPFGAHTTVNDALFMRVPVVTLAGRSFAARASASQVIAAGLPHLVAHDLASYRRIAAALASEAPARAACLGKLGAVSENALFAADAYANAFGEAVVGAWNER